MTTPRATDPALDAEVERAMKPYRHLPRAMQKVFRETLIRALTEDPKGKALLDRVRPPPFVTESGGRAKEGAGAAPAEPEREVSSRSGAPRGGGGGRPGGRL